MQPYLIPRAAAVERSGVGGRSGSSLAERLCVAVCLGALGALSWVPSASAGAKAISGRRYAVATESDAASRAAMRILEQGGNAVDAVTTAALVAGVASPSSSGLGGGGLALVWNAADHHVTSLDFRETAPAKVDAGAFERRPLAPAERGKLIGVPAEVLGLHELHRRFGKKSWADVVAPAIRIATDGYAVSAHLAEVVASNTDKLSADEILGALFVPGGHARIQNAKVKNPLLAGTLKRVAAEGPTVLYRGDIVQDLEAAAAPIGGVLTDTDFSNYKIAEREPLHVTWEGNDVYTMGPPSGGGVMLAEVLGTLSSSELKSLGNRSGAYTHLVAEALRGSLADRMRYVSDPDQQPVNVAKLLEPTRLAARRHSIALDRTRSLPEFPAEEHGTHAMVVADNEGNVVSLTTTVNHAFGAMVAGHATGIVLNDELDDFTSAKSVRALGLAESPNRARPGARPVSSMTPTIIVRDGVPVLALGGSGGMTIAPNVAEALFSRLVFGEPPDQAVSAPRFTIPTEGSTISIESTSTPQLQPDLESRGEKVSVQKSATHAVQMIAFENGRKMPAADPRKHGSAVAE